MGLTVKIRKSNYFIRLLAVPESVFNVSDRIVKIGPTVSAQLILLINPKIVRFMQCFSEHWCVCQPPDFVNEVDNTQTLRPAVTWRSVLQRVWSLNPTTK